MASKVTIEELVTKYSFDVDKSGQDAYNESVEDGAKAAERAAKKEQDARGKTADKIHKIVKQTAKVRAEAIEKGVKATEKAAKRAERSQGKSAKRTQRAVERSTSKIAAARARAAAASARGDSRGAKIAIAQALRAEKARTAATVAGARTRERAELRAQRAVRRASRQTTRTITREARKAARAVRKVNRGAGRSGRVESAKKFAGALGTIGVAAGAAAVAVGAATGAIVAFVNSQTAALDTIAKESKQVGLGAEEYQRLSFAAERSGTSIAGIGTAAKKISLQLLDAQAGGGKLFVDALGQIGLSIDDIEGKSFEERLGIISDAMNNTASDADKVGISAKLFGMRAGPELIPLLNEGRKGIEKLGAAAGDVFTSDELLGAEVYQDQMTDLKLVLSQTAGRLALELVPAVERAVVKFREWVKENEPLIREQAPKLIAFFSTVTGLISFLVESFVSLITSTGDLSTALETLALAFVAVKLALMGSAGLVAAAALAGIAIGNLLNSFGASDALADFLGQFESLNEAVARFLKLAPAAQGGITGNRGGGAKLAGGDIKTEKREKFTKNGKEFSISEKTLLDVALGDKTSDVLTQKEALNIVSQLDKEKDPDRKQRASQRGKAAAAKGEREKKKTKKGKGKPRKLTGLEAQIDKQIKDAASQAELRESARALRSGEDPTAAFTIGRDAAKATEARLRQRFESTGELPQGIARDIQQLSRSPAVEDAIGRVPPPVISVENNVTNITVSGNEFTTEVEAQLSGVGAPELGRAVAQATERMLSNKIGDAINNILPKTRV